MSELPSPPTLWVPSKAPPARAVSLDSAALFDDENYANYENYDDPMPLGATSFRQRAHLPAHALCKSKTRSYTSPHLISQTSVGGDSKENVSGVRNAANNTAVNRAESLSAVAEPVPLIPVDVFLAGSCNPTTWRRDTAIPMLEESSINYYNPQVDEWYDELMYEEARAKEGAKIILMVIDSATRSIVCINESVEYISRGRRLILVVQHIEVGTEVDGVTVSQTQLADLNGSRECLRRFAMRQGIRIFDNVADAVAETIACLVEENPKRFAPEMPRLRKRSSIILNEMAGQYRPRRNTSRSWSSTSLFSLVQQGSDDSDEWEGDEPQGDMSYVRHDGTTASRNRGGSVYLGGNLQSTSWREKVAIPKLQKAGLQFYIPYQDYLSVELQRIRKTQPVSRGADRWQEIEAERENAELILFVIPDRTRSIAAMTEAVELICNRHALFLVIEPLHEDCELQDGCTLSGREYKDVSRARSYLKEMAERHHVEVFHSVDSAVAGITARLHPH